MKCTGAVIGAGFASGREIVIFFTRYGVHGWWLAGLSAVTMALLCGLCMRASSSAGGNDWSGVLQLGKWTEGCSCLLMVLTAGAMIAAAGHMVALLWPHVWAYPAGALGTLLLAWRMGYGRMKGLSLISGVLTLALLCALLAILAGPVQNAADFRSGAEASDLPGAALRAVGYASMNMMLAIGVVCRCASAAGKISATSAWLGGLTGMLLLSSHCVYSRHPEAVCSDFPMIVLIGERGRTGYVFGAVLLYLAILTTLISVMYSIRIIAKKRFSAPRCQLLMTLGLPLAVSGLGFSAIVDRFYAPAGLLCLLVVFMPLVGRLRRCEGKNALDISV